MIRHALPCPQHLAREIRIWSALDHEYVLPFLGYFTEGEDMVPNLVTQWMVFGALDEYAKTFPRASEETWNLVRLLLRLVQTYPYSQ